MVFENSQDVAKFKEDPPLPPHKGEMKISFNSLSSSREPWGDRTHDLVPSSELCYSLLDTAWWPVANLGSYMGQTGGYIDP